MRRRTRRIILAVALIGALAVGGAAFTASNTFSGPSVAGYGNENITGASRSPYTLSMSSSRGHGGSSGSAATPATTSRADCTVWPLTAAFSSWSTISARALRTSVEYVDEVRRISGAVPAVTEAL